MDMELHLHHDGRIWCRGHIPAIQMREKLLHSQFVASGIIRPEAVDAGTVYAGWGKSFFASPEKRREGGGYLIFKSKKKGMFAVTVWEPKR